MSNPKMSKSAKRLIKATVKNIKADSRYASTFSKVPGRLRGGKSSYKKSKAASKALASFGEVKIQPLRDINNLAPVQMNLAAAGVAPVYGTRFLVGNPLTQYVDYQSLGGMTWFQGTDADQRIGNYMYFKKIHMTLQVNMNQVGQTNSGPRKFRLIIFKARRTADPTGITFDPNRQLMLTSGGNAFGVSTATLPVPNGIDFTTQITNKRNFQIYKDSTFILQNPVGDPSASVDPFIGTSGQYKAQRTIKCSLPLWRKTRMEQNIPTELNYNYGVYLQAVNVGSNTAIPDDWTVSLRGTVSANDV